MGVSTPAELAQTVRDSGVRDEGVLAAIRAVPRADFVPAEQTGQAYLDMPVRITHDQVTTQPSLVARMIEGLSLSGDEHVLEVGTGYGFQSALLAAVAADVVSIERWPDMVEQARRNLDRHGIDTVRLRVGDGSLGAPEEAPFDAIVVSAAYPDVPAPLIDQLRVGGRLVQPIGPGGDETVVVFDRTPDGLVRGKELIPARFVPLRGRHGFDFTQH